jgi:septal ring factor EnvC (AmiA/AmiB activator)
MAPKHSSDLDIETQPITFKAAFMYGGAVATILGVFLGAGKLIMDIKTTQTSQELKLSEVIGSIKQVDENSLFRHNTQQKEIDKLSDRTDLNQTNISDIKAQIGILTTKFEQFEKTQQNFEKTQQQMFDFLKEQSKQNKL